MKIKKQRKPRIRYEVDIHQSVAHGIDMGTYKVRAYSPVQALSTLCMREGKLDMYELYASLYRNGRGVKIEEGRQYRKPLPEPDAPKQLSFFPPAPRVNR